MSLEHKILCRFLLTIDTQDEQLGSTTPTVSIISKKSINRKNFMYTACGWKKAFTFDLEVHGHEFCSNIIELP